MNPLIIRPEELIVDNFAGGGGASTGIEQALGRPVDIAINHDPAAIATHKINHPHTQHYCESVWDIDPVKACKGRPVGLAWFSPDCKHFSKAKGSRPVDKHIRGLAWIVLRWASVVPMRMFMLENVEEFKTWGPLNKNGKPSKARQGETYRAFIAALTTGLSPNHPAMAEIKEALGDDFDTQKIEQGLGYTIESNILSACDYGAPTTRKRFFLVGRCDGEPIQWPEPTHGNAPELQPYITAADIIDWSLPCPSIFNRKRPLVENTMKRIAKGLDRFVFGTDTPFIIQQNAPFITEHANASNQRNMPANQPLRTICAQVKGGHFALVSAFLTKFRTGATGADLNTPLPTITAGSFQKRPGGNGHAMGIVTSHMIKFRGQNVGSRTDEPIHTISAGGNHIGEVRAFLVKYYGTNFGQAADQPLQTITTKHRFGLVTIQGIDYQIADIGMRMLQPRELFKAQGFPDSYIIDHDLEGNKLSKANQVARCGNSVCPPVAKALVIANTRINQVVEVAA